MWFGEERAVVETGVERDMYVAVGLDSIRRREY